MKNIDLYKFTMLMAVLDNFGAFHTCTFRFKNRGPEKLGVLAEAIKARFMENGKVLRPVDITPKSIKFLNKTGIDLNLLKYVANLTFEDVKFVCENRDGDLFLEVTGLWAEVTLFEIAVLSAVQEEWSRYNGWLGNKDIFKQGILKLEEKVQKFNACSIPNFTIIEMGTRRAFSNAWLCYMISYLAWNLKSFNGTSNVGMAMELDVPCRGTMAHEYLQMGQVLAPSLHQTNSFMLKAWLKTHGNKFNVALTDCLTSDVFLREFDRDLANAFKSTRQDSGNPIEYGDKFRRHYQKLGIIPKNEKRICFSDSLDDERALGLAGYFTDLYEGIDFGMGTFLSHDMGVTPLKIVMKMIRFDGKPVIKISDDVGKTMSVNDEYEGFVKKELGIL